MKLETPEIILSRSESIFDTPYIENEDWNITTCSETWWAIRQADNREFAKYDTDHYKTPKDILLPEKYLGRVKLFMTAPTAKIGQDLYVAESVAVDDFDEYDWDNCVLYSVFESRKYYPKTFETSTEIRVRAGRKVNRNDTQIT